MNRNLITIAFFVLVLVGLVGLVVLLIVAPSSVTEYMTALAVVLAIASTAALNFGGAAKLAEGQKEQSMTIDTIQRQTNGTTTALTDQLAKQGKQIDDLVAHLFASTPTSVIQTIKTPAADPGPRHVAL